MYGAEMATIEVKVVGETPELEKDLCSGGESLRDLCRKEVDSFDRHLRETVGGDYIDGLAKFERLAIEGFLYQKVRGHVPSEEDQEVHADRGRQDGTS